MNTHTPRNADGTWRAVGDLIKAAEGNALATGIIIGVCVGAAAAAAGCWIYDACTKKEKAK